MTCHGERPTFADVVRWLRGPIPSRPGVTLPCGARCGPCSQLDGCEIERFASSLQPNLAASAGRRHHRRIFCPLCWIAPVRRRMAATTGDSPCTGRRRRRGEPAGLRRRRGSRIPLLHRNKSAQPDANNHKSLEIYNCRAPWVYRSSARILVPICPIFREIIVSLAATLGDRVTTLRSE
ncbi:hypothetical protein FAGKG844_290014 [Frankia sp. AgKG'84/4]